jgi:hypothetical protein
VSDDFIPLREYIEKQAEWAKERSYLLDQCQRHHTDMVFREHEWRWADTKERLIKAENAGYVTRAELVAVATLAVAIAAVIGSVLEKFIK